MTDTYSQLSQINPNTNKALFVKQAVNDEQNFNTLLDYYRNKITNFEYERIEWLAKLEQIDLKQKDVHSIEWELQNQRKTVLDLQKQLSEAKLFLYEERCENLKLSKEIEELRLSNQNPNFYNEQEYGNNIKETVKRMQKLYEANIQELKKQLQIREDQLMTKIQSDQIIMEQLLTKNQKLEQFNRNTNQDYFKQRIVIDQDIRKVQEENELLRLKNAELVSQNQEIQKHANVDVKVNKELMTKKTCDFTDKYRNTIKQKEDEIIQIKKHFAQLTDMYIEKIKSLEESLQKTLQKYKSLDQKHKQEVDGLRNELKKALEKLKEYEDKPQLPVHATLTKAEQEKALVDKLQKEAQQIKEQAQKDLVKTYKKTKKTPSSQKLSRSSRKSRQDQDEDSESIPIQELEELQQQLQELERKIEEEQKNHK